VRTINTAQVTFASTYPAIGFATDLATLGGSGTTASSTGALLLDSVLGCGTPGSGASCTKSGYIFTVSTGLGSGTPQSTFAVNANPVTVDQTGKRFFFSDSSGVIRYNTTASATSTDSSLQ
jgi:hypothetical protein